MQPTRNVMFDIPEELAHEAELLGLDIAEASRKGFWLVMR